MAQEIKASMAGSVWKIVANEGQSVTDGQDIIILESMKMEIPHEAEADGTVAKITVAEGDFVEENDILVELA